MTSYIEKLEKRKRLRRQVMPGFPWEGRFETKEEIHEYFSGDKIQCLLCGRWFEVLNSHLGMIHGVTYDEYKEKYGLPWSHGLCGQKLSHKRSQVMHERRENGFRPDLEIARIRPDLKNRRPDQPFYKRIMVENIRAIHKNQAKYTHKDFQNVLKRMRETNRGFLAVCEDADLPSYRSVYAYIRRNPGFRKALDETYKKLPLTVQARAGKLE